MSKRVANTRARTARNRQYVESKYATSAPGITMDMPAPVSRVIIPRPKKSIWASFKDLFRRTQSR